MVEYNPRQYQNRMTQFVKSRNCCGLFAEMGLGKTVTTLTAIDDLINDEFKVSRVLILAPLRVALLTWPEEIEKWNHTRRLTYSVIYGDDRVVGLNTDTDIHLMSYSTLPWLVDYLTTHRRLPYTYDMVIYDESTYVKNKASKRWTICNALFYDVPRRVILTGTPTPNGLHDLWGQIFHLDHGQSLGASLTDYRRVYFLRNGHKYHPLKNAKTEISQRLAHLVMPMKAEDYLQLPPFTDNRIKCLLDEENAARYSELEREFFIEIAGTETTAFDAASLSAKLRQFVQGFLYDDTGGISWAHRLKIEALQDIVDNTDENILVAVQFKADVAMIRNQFGNVPAIYGESGTKEDIINIGKWNRGELKMLVAHPASLAHGVNLQSGGHTIVWYGIPWNLEHYSQFNARLYRQGQTRPVIAHHLIMARTIDEVVINVLRGKERTQEVFMRDVQAYRKQKQLGA